MIFRVKYVPLHRFLRNCNGVMLRNIFSGAGARVLLPLWGSWFEAETLMRVKINIML